MKLLSPLPRSLSRLATAIVLVLWALQMFVLGRKTLAAGNLSLASDLSAYGSSAQWRGVYSRGEKIGFLVGQTTPTADGYELREDGKLQMTLLGATSAALLKTVAQVDKEFNLRSFVFSLDPGSGPITVSGRLEALRLHLSVTTPGGTRTEVRDLAEAPSLSLNLSRRLAARGFTPGSTITVPVFDPATLRNAPMMIKVEGREVVRAGGRPVPAFKLTGSFSGVTATSWVTDTGEVVREESPLGLIIVRETRESAQSLAVPGQIQSDLLESAAVTPVAGSVRIQEGAEVDVLRARLEGFDLSTPDVQGAGQTVTGNEVVIVDAEELTTGPPEADLAPYLKPELFLESDAPEIVAEAQKALAGVAGDRKRAETLTRYVNALLEKRPTVSLPSALEVLRTRVGDCNEHTALYVAMARAAGIPARIAVGVVHLRGAFYYHAWPEVWVTGAGTAKVWLPLDPTLDQFPADPTHIRLARGGLDKQVALLPAIGRGSIKVLEVKVAPGSTPTLVGRPAHDPRPPQLDLPRREGAGDSCWSRPAS